MKTRKEMSEFFHSLMHRKMWRKSLQRKLQEFFETDNELEESDCKKSYEGEHMFVFNYGCGICKIECHDNELLHDCHSRKFHFYKRRTRTIVITGYDF